MDINGSPVIATIIRSSFEPEGVHFVVDIPKDVNADEFVQFLSQDGDVQAYKRALVTVDESECIQCGQCTASCAYGALVLDEQMRLVVNRDKCTGCRTCVDSCPRRCISVY